jgi:hypothetical protein
MAARSVRSQHSLGSSEYVGRSPGKEAALGDHRRGRLEGVDSLSESGHPPRERSGARARIKDNSRRHEALSQQREHSVGIRRPVAI